MDYEVVFPSERVERSFQKTLSKIPGDYQEAIVAAASFFGVLKRERVNRRQYRTRAEARADIVDDIERWHNPRQRRRLTVQR